MYKTKLNLVKFKIVVEREIIFLEYGFVRKGQLHTYKKHIIIKFHYLCALYLILTSNLILKKYS